jgi:hypothetical protein
VGIIHLLAQSVPDPTSALPGWIVGGGASGILTWLLVRAEKRVDEQTKSFITQLADKDERLDACEQRYRDMVERFGEKTYDAVAQIGRATEVVQRLADKRNGS